MEDTNTLIQIRIDKINEIRNNFINEYKEIRDKLLWYYGIEEMNKLYSYMSYLTNHSGDSIRNYIRATDYCDSLNGAFQKKRLQFNIARCLFKIRHSNSF